MSTYHYCQKPLQKHSTGLKLVTHPQRILTFHLFPWQTFFCKQTHTHLCTYTTNQMFGHSYAFLYYYYYFFVI